MVPSVEFGGIKYDNSGILLPTKGLYLVTYGVAVGGGQCTAARFQLTLNSANESTPVQGSSLSVTPNRQLATVSLLVPAQTDGSYLVIQNISKDPSNAPTPVVLNANGGVTAFINVIRLQ